MLYAAAETAVTLLESLGILIVVVGTLLGGGSAIVGFLKDRDTHTAYRLARHRIGAAILLGLEVLIGADIIRTVTMDFNFQSVAILAAIVLVRTFLSFALEVEMTGRWPWQGHWRSRTGKTE